MGEIIAIIILALVVVAQAIERYFFSKIMLRQMDDALKAALSRNVGEYLSAKRADEPTKEPPAQEEFVPVEEADDETFDKSLEIKK